MTVMPLRQNKIYLINPPASFLINDKNNLPYGLLYLSSYLKHHDINVSIIDLAGLSENDWVIPTDGKYYGVTATTPLFPTACKIAQYIKGHIGENAITILGGNHATALPEETLNNSQFDIIVIGEGEKTLLEILLNNNLNSIQGIAYKKDKKIFKNPLRPLIKNLDILPLINLSDINYKSYNCQVFSSKESRPVKGIDLITSRGCIYNCAFCASTQMWRHRIRFHSSSYVVSLLDYLRSLGYNNFYFSDDFFSLRRDIDPILTNLKNNNSNFRCLMRADKVSEDFIKELHDGGCRQIDLGVESGSQRILDVVNKKITVSQLINAIQTVQRNGIICKIFLIIGLPGESQGTINETIQFLKRANPDLVSVNMFVPLPGTPIWIDPQKYNLMIDYHCGYENYILGGKERNLTPIHSDKNELLRFQKQISDFLGIKDINIEMKIRNEK